jgi:hypothetical protein
MDKPAPLSNEPRCEAEYFYRREGDPPMHELIIGLEAVCKAIEAQAFSINLDDTDEVERTCDLGVAAAILARQLRDRHNVGFKPNRKRRSLKLEVVA